MSKKFKNKPCAYCTTNAAKTGDHVFAREFFVEDRRDDLPKVPACESCNNEKSRLEHYLTAVMPFGGKHPDALANLRDMVPGRLEKNMRLHRELTAGRERIASGEAAGQDALPFDGRAFARLFEFIVKGLAFHHWGVMLGEQHGVRVITITATDQQAFGVFLSLNAREQVNADLGKGTFVYQGKQGDYPEFTIWNFSAYGGLTLAGDPDAPHEVATGIGAITADREFLARAAVADIFGGELEDKYALFPLVALAQAGQSQDLFTSRQQAYALLPAVSLADRKLPWLSRLRASGT